MSNLVQHWDDMYAMPLENIPWEIKDPPKELTALLASGKLSGGRALDIACGTGNYAFYMAEHGFEVVGVDFAQNALGIATKRNKELALDVTFKRGDVTKLFDVLGDETFDFILDYSILHHIMPGDVAQYAKQFTRFLKPGGLLLLVCYSDEDGYSQGRVKVAGKYGNDMFYRTRKEIEALYAQLHEVSYRKTRLGKRA